MLLVIQDAVTLSKIILLELSWSTLQDQRKTDRIALLQKIITGHHAEQKYVITSCTYQLAPEEDRRKHKSNESHAEQSTGTTLPQLLSQDHQGQEQHD